ncbi:hypothetical protein EKA85_30825 [Pseudomonas veronii]|jgi:hypothetical protein|uniref:Lipoprotein n=1 Tax=Pseudomonas veronii 1YdBTEX2 TaxID=1295141 RepID=A0A1D3K2C2_PSEVE|nr:MULTISPECIES: hypothetical protein [Pseudomonas]MCI1737799.1 hypothetical protein [Pseudomonas veronii]MDY7554825.1 hypothetical protein [Pseudomonas sp. FG1]MEB0053811.1 hypothetical protein [Pseudomonas sp. FG1]RTY59647.1 hypothetical protein EKA85_30825 [Pseudomonas veronii]SBW82504.1 hypothetical protein PVE_R1G4622 [Pseudomonas veronii 1YdBTEX2]
MRILFFAMCCLLITACSSNPTALFEEQVKNSTTPLARTPSEAMHNAQAVPMPINPGWRPPQWKITAAEPRILISGVPSNYRLFSVALTKDKPFHIDVNSWCVNGCLGFSKYALNPYLILMDAKGNVQAEGFGKATGIVGVISQVLKGTVTTSGTYYLIVAADNRAPGETIVIDNVLLIGAAASPITPLRIGMGSYPFGSVGPLLNTEETP